MAKILKFLHQSIFDYLCLQNRWAEMLAKVAIKNLPQMKMRAEKSDGDLDYEENFYILKHTACPDIPTQPERNRIRRGLDRLWILAADIQRLLHTAPLQRPEHQSPLPSMTVLVGEEGVQVIVQTGFINEINRPTRIWDQQHFIYAILWERYIAMIITLSQLIDQSTSLIKKLLRNVRCMFVLHLEIAIDTTAISVSSETIFTSNNGYNTLLG